MQLEETEEQLKRFSALQYAAELSQPKPAAGQKQLATSQLIAYAKRQNCVADIVIERILKQQLAARQVYDRALRSHALAWSEMANAAAGGARVVRRVGAHRVELIEEKEGPYLVIYLSSDQAPPKAIEVRDTAGVGTRLALGAPQGAIIQLRLDMTKQDPLQVHSSLSRPDSVVFLL